MPTTSNHPMTGAWELVHASTSDGTVAAFTPRGTGVEWSTKDGVDVPDASLLGHIAKPEIDRNIFLATGERLYLKGLRGSSVALTITPGA